MNKDIQVDETVSKNKKKTRIIAVVLLLIVAAGLGIFFAKQAALNNEKIAFIKQYVSFGMGNPKLMSNVMARIRVPLPSFKEQVRIAAILDRFDTLCNDLISGLPAEIEARKKQYEYYRDKLLSFQPLA